MAKNYIAPGKVVTVTASADTLSGAGVLVGTLFGVATHSALSGEPLEIKTDGVWEMPKTSAQAWTVGAAIYSTAAGVLTNVAGTDVLVGKAVAVAANPSATGFVRLNG